MIKQFKGQCFKLERVDLLTRRDCDIIYISNCENRFCLVNEDYYAYYVYYFVDQKYISHSVFDIYPDEELEVSDCECSNCSEKCNIQKFLTCVCGKTLYFFYCQVIGTINQVVLDTKEEKSFNLEMNILDDIQSQQHTDFLILLWRNFRVNPQVFTMEIRNTATFNILMKFENLDFWAAQYFDLKNQRFFTIDYPQIGRMFQLRQNKLHLLTTVVGTQFQIKDKLFIKTSEKDYKICFYNSRLKQFRKLKIDNDIPNTGVSIENQGNYLLFFLSGLKFKKVALYQWWKGQIKEDNVLVRQLYKDPLAIRIIQYKIYILKYIPLEQDPESIDEIEGYVSEDLD